MNVADLRGSDVVVVGLGAATAIGQGALSTAAAVRAGISGFSDHPFMIDARGDPFVIAMAPYLPPVLENELRMMELARLASKEAMSVVPRMHDIEHVDMIVGLPSPRPGLHPDLATRLGEQLAKETFDGICITSVQLLTHGHSAGLIAIGEACRELRDGTAVFLLAGGVDSYIDPDTLEWLDDCERLHIPTNAWGFLPGEAAGFCLLCSAATAASCGLEVLGKIAAMSTADEPNRIYTKTVCIGEGLTKAVRRVLGFMPHGAKIDATLCDQNGEAYRADEFGFALARTSECFVDPTDFGAPADCWGDVGAASGPLFVMLAAVAANKGYAKGPRTLLWTSSEGGERSAVLFEAEPKPLGSR